VTANVAHLMSRRLEELPESTLRACERASCIGNRFDLEVAALMAGTSRAGTARDLQPALEQGLLLAEGDWQLAAVAESDEGLGAVEYRFAHDQIQAAAYDRLDPNARARLHRDLALAWQKTLDDDGRAGRLFDIVRQANAGLAVTDDAEERAAIAQLNLDAARRAVAASAFSEGLRFVEQGIGCLPSDAWKRRYPLALHLHRLGAQAGRQSANYEAMEVYSAQVIEHGRDLLDVVPIHENRLQYHVGRLEPGEAMRVGLDVLRQLGVKLPPDPGLLHVARGLIATLLRMRGRTPDDVLALPPMSGERELAAMRVLMGTISPAYIASPNLFPLIVFSMVELSLKHGNSSQSPFGWMIWGVLLNAAVGKVDEGDAMGSMSMQLMERLGASELKAKLAVSWAVVLDHWKRPLRRSLGTLEAGHVAGLESGDVEYACHNAMYWCNYALWTGEPLDTVLQRQAQYVAVIERLSSDFHGSYARVFHQFARNIVKGGDGASDLSGPVFDMESEFATFQEANNLTGMFVAWHARAALQYLFGRPQEAAASAKAARKYGDGVLGSTSLVQNTVVELLAGLDADNPTPIGGARLALAMRKLRSWAGHAPMNYGAKRSLVEAELARHRGRVADAMARYDEAIALADEAGLIADLALAAQLASRFYEGLGRGTIAGIYRLRAARAWDAWGATALRERLVESGPRAWLTSLDSSAPSGDGSWTATSTSYTSSGSVEGGRSIDFESAVRAARAISEEILLDVLLDSLMDTLLSNAGAQRGLLILDRREGLVVEAEASVDAQTVFEGRLLLTEAEASGQPAMAHSAVQYVARTGEPLLLVDASADPRFAADRHVVDAGVRSLLCLPLQRRRTVVGVVYLENNSAPGVFTTRHQELVGVLAGQAAISLRNATLYAELKQSLEDQRSLTQSYERFVPRAFLEHLDKASIVDVALGDQVQREMTVLFLDLRGFTSLSERLPPKMLFDLLNRLLSRLSPRVREAGGFVDKYIGDAIMALFPRSPKDAIQAAVAMRRELRSFNAELAAAGEPPLDFGVGIHTGSLMLGTIGEAERMESTVIADAVNIAARLEGLTKRFGAGILVERGTFERSGSDVSYRLAAKVQVKGRAGAVEVVELLAEDEPGSAAKLRTKDRYEAGLRAYFSAQFDEARAAFGAVLNDNPDDRAADELLRSLDGLSDATLPAAWSGALAAQF